MEKDYDEKKPLFDDPEIWCKQAGLEKNKGNIIIGAKSTTHSLSFKRSLALAVEYYKKLMEPVEKFGSASSSLLEIQEKDINHISISNPNMEKAIGLAHIELIKKHNIYFSNKHDKILKHIL